MLLYYTALTRLLPNFSSKLLDSAAARAHTQTPHTKMFTPGKELCCNNSAEEKYVIYMSCFFLNFFYLSTRTFNWTFYFDIPTLILLTKCFFQQTICIGVELLAHEPQDHCSYPYSLKNQTPNMQHLDRQTSRQRQTNTDG